MAVGTPVAARSVTVPVSAALPQSFEVSKQAVGIRLTGKRLLGGQEATVVLRAEDKPVVAAEPSLVARHSGLLGSFTRVDPDDVAPILRP